MTLNEIQKHIEQIKLLSNKLRKRESVFTYQGLKTDTFPYKYYNKNVGTNNIKYLCPQVFYTKNEIQEVYNNIIDYILDNSLEDYISVKLETSYSTAIHDVCYILRVIWKTNKEELENNEPSELIESKEEIKKSNYIYGNPFTIKFGRNGAVCVGFCKQASRVKIPELGFNIRTPGDSLGYNRQQLYFKTREDAEKFLNTYGNYIPNYYSYEIKTGIVLKDSPAVNISKDPSMPVYCKEDSLNFDLYVSQPHYAYIKSRLQENPTSEAVGDIDKLKKRDESRDSKEKATKLYEDLMTNMSSTLTKDSNGNLKYKVFMHHNPEQNFINAIKRSLESKTEKGKIKDLDVEMYSHIYFNDQDIHSIYDRIPSFPFIVNIHLDGYKEEIKLNSIKLNISGFTKRNLIEYFQSIINFCKLDLLADSTFKNSDYKVRNYINDVNERYINYFIYYNDLDTDPIFKEEYTDINTFSKDLNKFLVESKELFMSSFNEEFKTDIID